MNSSSAAAVCVSATEAELARVSELLAREGTKVSRESLAARLDGDDSGILLCTQTTASWVLDGGALHVYDIVARDSNGAELDVLMTSLNLIARARFAAVLVATVFEDASSVRLLLARGFEIDAAELDTRADMVVRMLTLLREVE